MPRIVFISFVLAATILAASIAAQHGAAAEDPIIMASVFALTGEAAEENSPNFVMVRLAVKRANDSGGVLGRRIRLVEIDNRSTALGSRLAAREAVEAGAVAVVGPSWSSHAMAMAPELQQAGIPMVGATTTAPEVTEAGDYVFRACYTNKSQAAVLAQFARNDLRAETAALMIVAGDVYSEDLARQFEAEFTRRGGTVALKEPYLLSSMDFEPQLAAVAAARPDAVFVPGFARDSGLILRQARAKGITVPFLGGDGWTALEEHPFIGSLTGDNYYVSHWHPDSATPENLAFLAMIRGELGPEALDSIDAGTPVAFDAANLVIDAIRRAGSADPAALRDALSRTRDFRGVTGSITLDEHRNPIKPLVLLKIADQSVHYVKTITPQR